MARLVDLSGQRFGRLLVLKHAEKHGTKWRWECLCTCGQLSYAYTSDLLSGKHTSCGCYHRERVTKHGALVKPRVEIGARFGRLTVSSRLLDHPDRPWYCQCDCGHMATVAAGDLLNRHVKSCGCLRRDMGSVKRTRQLQGQRFGRLLVLKRGEPISRVATWLCQCDCGNETTVRTYCLTSGMTQSCGCLRRDNVSKRSLHELTGQTFHYLTVICRGPDTGTGRHVHVQWVCQCRCKTICIIEASKLTSGWTKSCGCIRSDILVPEDQRRLLRSTHNSWNSMKQRCTNPNTPGYHYYGGRGITFYEPWRQFKAFLHDVGIKPSDGHSLDRYPNPNGNYEPGNVRWATKLEQALNRKIPDTIRFPERHLSTGRFITGEPHHR